MITIQHNMHFAERLLRSRPQPSSPPPTPSQQLAFPLCSAQSPRFP